MLGVGCVLYDYNDHVFDSVLTALAFLQSFHKLKLHQTEPQKMRHLRLAATL